MLSVVDIGDFVEAVKKAAGQSSTLSIVQKNPKLKKTADVLHDAICEHGFCFLTNHGVPQSVVDKAFASSKSFFELDPKIKEKYARGLKTNNGWVALERERLNEKRSHSDLKEAFNFSPCEVEELPCEVPDMNQSFHDLFKSCHLLSSNVLDLLGVALELEDPSLLSRSHQLGGKKEATPLYAVSTIPLLPISRRARSSVENIQTTAPSLLFQDDTGGLQILGKDGEYHDVLPVAGAVVVNVGDLIQRWTADKYPATKHRVIVPAAATKQGRTRQSMAFFCHPDDDTLITCLDGSNTYPPITSYDYVMSRFAVTY